MDIIPVTESDNNVREEANKRTCKAGYTDRDGQPIRNKGAGKGDNQRHTNKELYDQNYAKCFGHN